MKTNNPDVEEVVIKVSVWEDGSMRIIEDGQQTIIAVPLSDHERRSIWNFKQRHTRV